MALVSIEENIGILCHVFLCKCITQFIRSITMDAANYTMTSLSFFKISKLNMKTIKLIGLLFM